MTISEGNLEQLVQPGDGILSDIWDALRKEKTTRSLDLSCLSINVHNGEVYLDGYLEPENQPLVESTINSVLGVVEVHNRLRTNDGILADIWNALWKDDSIRSLELNNLLIHVKHGEVYLFGHLAQQNNLLQIERIAQSVAGVVAVHNYLVTDRELIIQVSQALARDERTCPFILPVCASHGWVSLGGEVPTCELQNVVEEVAAGVSGVRGVIALPRVTGESPDTPPIAVQPRIGAAVYGRKDDVGEVSHVVIQPEDRLVTHVVVHSNAMRDIHLVDRETVVPVQDIDRVNDESVFLGRNGPSLSDYPLFDPLEYPLAPFAWNAPYPYTTGQVLWSLRQSYEVPGTSPATSVESVSSERKADGTSMNPALVRI